MDLPPDEEGKSPSMENHLTGEDDCLYLSVQLPALKDKSERLPVIFYIHGGSFQFGSGAPATIKFKYLADKDLVFVSMNYRVGIQGMEAHHRLPVISLKLFASSD
jgi:carboxylesterase type B